jgi:hypothetical protein
MALLNIWPAYGRVYGTVEQAMDDWKRGKDFASDLGYCSIRNTTDMQMEFDVTVIRLNLTPKRNHFCFIFLDRI